MQKHYLSGERGNRLYPKRTHARHWVLTSLTNKLINILNQTNEKKKNVLDYGCGNKPYKELFINTYSEYVGADLQGNNLADIIINDDGTLPLTDESFDCVLSTQVLEHVADPTLYLKESYRVLQYDGKLILSTHGFWIYHPDPNDFWRWTSAGLRRIIEDAGFTIEKMYSVLSLPTLSIQFWQDATMYKLPAIIRKYYVLICQLLMEYIDKRNVERFNDNAGVFVVVARKVR